MVTAQSSRVDSSLRLLELSTMNAGDKIVTTKLKIKISSKGLRAESKEDSKMNTNLGQSMPTDSNKRASEVLLGNEREKRRKMDRNVRQQCSNIVKALMAHPSGWPFLAPVDPVQYNIPDYFTVITKPMDLGTVKAKLDRNVYFDVDEFAADVKLTFANAMKYNPPNNEFHIMAMKLDNVFKQRWKLLEGKWKAESKKFSQNCVSSVKGNVSQETPFKKFVPHANGLSKRQMPLEEKQKLKKELVDLLGGNVVKKIHNALQKFGLVGAKEEKVNLDLNKYDDETLFELKKVVRAYSSLATKKVEPESVKQSGGLLLSRKTVHKDNSISSIFSANTKQAANSDACHSRVVDTHALPRNLPTERKLDQEVIGVSKRDREVMNSSASVSSRSDLDHADSHGGRGLVYEENSCPSPSPSGSIGASTEETGWDSQMNADLSPNKALRAAMLKSRFADTIIKAKHKSLPIDGGKADLCRLQQEKARLERQQLQEKARIEAELKAAEEASRKKAEADSKMQLERDREAARIALQQMEKTVEFEDNLKILRELEKLCKCCSGDGITIILGKNPLERLGLCIKEDYYDEEDEEVLSEDCEEGEILS